MIDCARLESADVELYFYGELDPLDRARVDAHLRGCAPCRQRLEDLHAIRRALASQPAVDAPPAGDWSGFMRRLDGAVGMDEASSVQKENTAGTSRRWSARQVLALAAMLALVTIGVGVVMAARFRAAPVPAGAAGKTPGAPAGAPVQQASTGADRSLREGSAEHLERSKLVVLGLATRDPRQTRAEDWQYERRLAGALLSDTRLYRQAALDRGVSDVERVMRDLETVLLEVSMSDTTDRDALERVQRLIAKRDLVVKMQVATSGAAGI